MRNNQPQPTVQNGTSAGPSGLRLPVAARPLSSRHVGDHASAKVSILKPGLY
jgi:hypothetical protein